MKNIKDFFESFENDPEKQLAKIIEGSISEKGFNSSTLDKKIEGKLDKIESDYKLQFKEDDDDKTEED